MKLDQPFPGINIVRLNRNHPIQRSPNGLHQCAGAQDAGIAGRLTRRFGHAQP